MFALLILVIFLSGYLSYAYSVGSDEGVCIVDNGDGSSCSDVQGTAYGSFLGVKVCHLGLVAFIVLFLLYLFANIRHKHRKLAFRFFIFGSFVGSLVALYFLIIQFFVLKTLCSTCIMIDVSTILIFVLTITEHRYGKRWI